MKYFKLLPKTNIDFIGMRKWLFVFSAVLMLACFGSIIFKGMNYGIDFTGGTVMQVHFKAPIDIKDIRSALSEQNINADIQTFIGKNTYAIKVKGSQEDVNDVSSKIETALNSTNVAFDVEQKDFVGPTVGNHLAKKSFFCFRLCLGRNDYLHRFPLPKHYLGRNGRFGLVPRRVFGCGYIFHLRD